MFVPILVKIGHGEVTKTMHGIPDKELPVYSATSHSHPNAYTENSTGYALCMPSFIQIDPVSEQKIPEK